MFGGGGEQQEASPPAAAKEASPAAAAKPTAKAKTKSALPRAKSARPRTEDWRRTGPQPTTTDAEEVAELKAMMGSPPKHHTSSSTSSSIADRPKWDHRPRYNPPGGLRGVRPTTNEPWSGVQDEDIKSRLDYGHEHEYEYRDDYNSFVENARIARQQNASEMAWDSSVVRHAPRALRGQSTRRAEPWSKFHNDEIGELNAVDDTSVNEFYAITADRDNRVKSTIVQPSWDDSRKLGRPSMKLGGPGRAGEQMRYNKQRAAAFRDARRPGQAFGTPLLPARPDAKKKRNAKTTR